MAKVKHQARGKIVWQMTRDGAAELNKATGALKRISARERDSPPDGTDENAGLQAVELSGSVAADAAQKTANRYIRKRFRARRAAASAQPEAARVTATAQRNITMQKQRIKRDYAKSFRQRRQNHSAKTAQTARGMVNRIRDGAQQAVTFAARNWKGIAVICGLLAMLIFLIAGISSCMSIFSGVLNGAVGTSFVSADTDITGTDVAYTALESALSSQIESIESEYTGYNEYNYTLNDVGHDPFALASFLTARLGAYTQEEAQTELEELFAKQYTLTVTPVTETRTRTETRERETTVTDPVTGEEKKETETYDETVTYDYYILNVSLTNNSVDSAARAIMTPEQTEMYAVYMENKGNRPDLFADSAYVDRGEYTDYDIPPEALTDTTFAAMIQEAELYLGYPYVWGGSTPASSFDCSGFVCWVVNQSGAGSVGRTTANGLYNHCANIPKSEARPGDLIFFQGTYDTRGASHVGIYTGGGMMIHCGNPISYASVNTPYWTSHFLGYGRLP